MKKFPANAFSQPPKTNTKKGFSLVVALALMGFILLMLLSLTLVVQLETQASTVSVRNLQARQNALLGMQIALSELQAAAGPDQRMVARGDLLSQHPAVNQALTPNDPRRLWVGVAHSDGTSNIEPSNNPVHWLVSGLNNPGDFNSGLQNPGDTALLFGENSVAASADAVAAGLTDQDFYLEAGKVFLYQEGVQSGAYAWIIDDETQKAKLGPSNPEVSNETPSTNLVDGRQRSVLPGYYDIADTTALTADATQLSTANNLKSLGIISTANENIIKDYHFDYTVNGFGVLADTRNGGLKRDLTAAFENPQVFNDLFPNTSEPPYITMDETKFNSSEASDLQSNGYIHMGIFRDYYNLKDYIVNDPQNEFEDGTLPISVFDQDLVNATGPQDLRQGKLGPHEINEEGHPYGSFEQRSGLGSGNGYPAMDYRHNPITPILAFMQQNAWLDDYQNTPTGYYLYKRGQLWLGVYNPYNIKLQIGTNSTGPKISSYPHGYVTLWDKSLMSSTNEALGREIDRENVFYNGRMMSAKEPLILNPGRTQILGFEDDIDVFLAKNDVGTFSTNILNATTKSSNRERNMGTEEYLPTQEFTMKAEFVNVFGNNNKNNDDDQDYEQGPNMSWGYEDPDEDFEVAQVFYTPFASDIAERGGSSQKNKIKSGQKIPGKVIFRDRKFQLGTSGATADEAAFYTFKLRTTRENNSRIRPLIDGNIRAIWNNPKWDNDMGLDVLATYSVDSVEFPDAPGNDGQYVNMVASDLDPEEAYLVYGKDDLGSETTEQLILFDIPREPLVSLGQLQHAAAGRFSYEPTYIVGNSYANVRIPLNNWSVSASDEYSQPFIIMNWEIPNNFYLYDASYLVNEALFDGYTFTTIPQDSTQAELDAMLVQDTLLGNPRFIPYEPEGFTFDTTTLQAVEAGRTNAGMVLVDGAFNVNSTSVEAWEAFLSGTKGLPYQKMDEDGDITGFEDVDGVRFPRVQTVMGEDWETTPDENYWTGFRSLTDVEVRELAEEIVDNIKTRGPFFNMSDFVNRELMDADEGKSGVLQAALDATINDTIPSSFEANADDGSFSNISADSTQGAGFPGQLLQGDILQALAPYMQTRSDTFKIRSYGETIDPLTQQTTGQAWCEAVVQRMPEPVDDPTNTSPASQQLATPTSDLGRQFRIVSFRWLDKDEI